MRKLILLVLALALATTGVALAAKPRARATSGVAYVGVTHKEGAFNYIAGDVKDKVFGRATISYKAKIGSSTGGVRVTAPVVTLYTAQGSLTGTGSADVKLLPGGGQKVLNGIVKFTKGTAELKGHTGNLKFTGDYDTKAGTYTFNYTGTYK